MGLEVGRNFHSALLDQFRDYCGFSGFWLKMTVKSTCRRRSTFSFLELGALPLALPLFLCSCQRNVPRWLIYIVFPAIPGALAPLGAHVRWIRVDRRATTLTRTNASLSAARREDLRHGNVEKLILET